MCTNPKRVYLSPVKAINWLSFGHRLYKFNKDGKRSFVDSSADIVFDWKSEKHEQLVKYGFDVDCGHCEECLSKRQNDYAQYVTRVSQSFKTMFYCTLTYDDYNIPVSLFRVHRSEVEGKEVVDYVEKFICSAYHPRIRNNKDIYNYVDSYREKLRGCLSGKPNHSVTFGNPDEYFCYSLCRRDVAKWLKRCRVQYLRQYDKPMSDFKVFYCSEYGTQTHRPHYHLAVANCTEEEFLYMVSKWHFGFVDLSNYRVAKGNEGFVAKYLTKYIVKGSEFEFDDLLYCERPRFVMSLNLLNLTEQEKDFYLGKDLYENGSFPCDDYEKLSIVNSRIENYLGSNMPICKHIRRKLFYEKVKVSNNKFVNFVVNGRKCNRKKYYNGFYSAPIRRWKDYAQGNAKVFFTRKIGLVPSFKLYCETLDVGKIRFVPIPLQIALTSFMEFNSYSDYKRKSEQYYGRPYVLQDNDFRDYLQNSAKVEKTNRVTYLQKKLKFSYSLDKF